MKAIILAAGQGKRIKKFHKTPKAFIKIPKIGKTLIERNIELLKKYGVKKIIIVTGYKKKYFQKLKSNNVILKEVTNFKKFNNYFSLLNIKKLLVGNIIILFSDILISENIIQRLSKIKKKMCLVIDKNKKLTDTMRVIIRKNKILDVGSHIDKNICDGNFIGIAKFNAKGSKILKDNLIRSQKYFRDYYLKALIKRKLINQINFMDVKKKFWLEIDKKKDLQKLDNIRVHNLK